MPSAIKVVLFLAFNLATFSFAVPAGETPQGPRVWSADTAFAQGTPAPTKAELDACVNTAVKKLGIDVNMKTDTKILADILNVELHMKEMPEVQALFKQDLEQSQSLAPLLSKVREGITVNHPAVGVALCTALADQSTAATFAAPNNAVLTRSIHHMFLLEKLTERAAENMEFMEKLHAYFDKTIKGMSPRKTFVGRAWDIFRAAGIFGLAKSYSINDAVNDYIKFRANGAMTPEEVTGRIKGLKTNVLEATGTDTAKGYLVNAAVGLSLSKWKPSTIKVDGPNKLIKYVVPMDYARLYETWNFAFITANLQHHELVYAKLLIPRVVLAKGEDYLYNRVVSLWMTINFYLMASLDNRPKVIIPNNVALATLWGKINQNYLASLPPRQ